ncbi:MAG: haloperoxidase [Cytophaga sp.]|nr:haloperoxidase [Cytophaga sp.]
MIQRTFLSLAIFVFFSDGIAISQNTSAGFDEAGEFANTAFHLSEVMVHDVANPPAASRFYAYAMEAAHQAILMGTDRSLSFDHLFHTLPAFEWKVAPRNFNKSLAANYAMLETGRLMMPSGYLLKEKQERLVARYKKERHLSGKEISYTVQQAEWIALQVVAYARSDGYTRLSTWQRYSPQKTEGHWYPTPPEYMLPVEAHWSTIRPFFIRSGSAFAPAPPVPFSTDKNSDFYKLMKEVHDTTSQLTPLQTAIANFWDCNPFAVKYSGHMSIGLKKISPGGHWIGITGIICKQKKSSLDSTVYAHALVALTIHDAFISCWTEKYTSDRIRPETAINKYMDAEWRPLLQTPPFPEYTSGHSVVSSASAEILSYLFGDAVRYTDTSEEYFGIPARTFNSFRDAANEAAISRLYGGIHFRDAIVAGQIQGKQVARYILDQVNSKKEIK